ncbi:MAG: AgmX/PglI C-terminal domain-containing protein [Myxococcota bacterium]
MWVTFVLMLLAEPPADPMLKVKIQIVKMINESGPAIDQCNAKYLDEYPGQTGQSELTLVVDKIGRVSRSKADTSLRGARNLRACLASVGRSWKFPPPEEERTISFTVPVSRLPFRLLMPGEKPEPAPAPEPSEPEGFLNLSSFLPAGW